MYNGIGLQTARGSGTNGYVQRNLSFLRIGKPKFEHKTEEEIRRFDSEYNRPPNEEILEHLRKRKIEVMCLELEEKLEKQGLTDDEIKAKIDTFRKEQMEKSDKALEARREFILEISNNKSVKETHQLAELSQDRNDKLKSALGISEDFVNGSSLDVIRQAKEKQAALEQKLSNNKGMIEAEMLKNVNANVSNNEEKETKMKKVKKEESSSSDSSNSSSGSDSSSSSSSSDSDSDSSLSSSSDSSSGSSDSSSNSSESESESDHSRHRHHHHHSHHRGGRDSHHRSPDRKRRSRYSESSKDDKHRHRHNRRSNSSEERRYHRRPVFSKDNIVPRSRSRSFSQSVSPPPKKLKSYVSRRESLVPSRCSIEKNERYRSHRDSNSLERHNRRSSRDVASPSPRRGRDGGGGDKSRIDRYRSSSKQSPERVARYRSHSKHRSRSHSRHSRSKSFSPRDRRHLRSYSPESPRNRRHSPTPSSSSSSSVEDRAPSLSSSRSSLRSKSRSPSIPKGRTSPSYREKRRITSARKRPIPYRRSDSPFMKVFNNNNSNSSSSNNNTTTISNQRLMVAGNHFIDR